MALRLVQITLLAWFNVGIITPSYISFLHQVSCVLFPFFAGMFGMPRGVETVSTETVREAGIELQREESLMRGAKVLGTLRATWTGSRMLPVGGGRPASCTIPFYHSLT